MRKKKDNDPSKRTHWIHVRMDDSEYAAYKENLETSGLSQSEFIRAAVRRVKIKVTVKPPTDSRAIEALEGILAEYGKIGSNLNQIAYHMNKENPLTARLMKELGHCLADMSELKAQIEKLGDEL